MKRPRHRAEPVDMTGRRVLVTGANTGIGRATAETLASWGAEVTLACRSEDRTRPVVAAINERCGAERARFLALDLSDLDSVRAAASQVIDEGLGIDVLVANAGLAGQRGETRQGFELAFGTNHLGHFLFVTSLLEHLRAGTSPRLVVVSSDSHYDAKGIDPDAVTRPTRSRTGLAEYAVSKLANVAFAQELARRVPAEELGVHVLHPGVIGSDVWRSVPWPVRPLMTRFMATTEEGSQTSLHCATAPALEGTSGGYWSDCEPKEPSAVATAELGRELWARSEEWVSAG